MSAVLLILCLIFGLSVTSGIYIFIIGFLRNKNVSWLIEDEVRKTPFSQYYPHIAAADKWIQEHESYGLCIQSNDGLALHALWIPVKQAKATILLVHGYRSSYLVDFGPALDYYHSMGFNMLLPDQRSHGNSEGKYITFGVKESEDMRLWIDYHNTHFGTYPMILSGLSMGASTVIYMADKSLPNNVRGIVADCGFTSPGDILSTIFRKVTHLPGVPALWITDLLARFLLGMNLWQFDTKKVLANSALPIVMIHGKADNLVPCDMTIQGYNACITQKRLLLVDGADHGVSFLVAKEKYISLIETFFDEILEDK